MSYLPPDPRAEAGPAPGLALLRARPLDGPWHGRVALEGSKSIANRVLVIDALAREAARSREGASELRNLALAEDTRTLRALLASDAERLDAGAAGTTYRFLTAWLARGRRSAVLDGSERMRQRPIGILVDALRALGAEISYAGREGYPPLRIEGRPLRGGALSVPAHVSSQYISALLLIAPTLAEGLTLTLEGRIGSRPYIDMTLGLMRRFGAVADWTEPGGRVLRVEPGAYRPAPFRVEGDWSAASYYYGLTALLPEGSTLRVDGLDRDSLQGDAALVALYPALGVETAFTAEGVLLTATGRRAERFSADFTHCPDLAQTVMVSCAALGVPARATGLESLAIKETDRTAALRTELARFGVRFDRAADHGTSGAWELSGHAAPPAGGPSAEGPVHTYEDHRMAMAFAPLALAVGELRIAEPMVVAKSYPTFWTDWSTMPVDLRLLPA